MNTPTHHEAPIDRFEPENDGMVHTTSRFCMWPLTALGGYRVVGSTLISRSTVLGGTRYTRVCDLMPPRET